MRRHHRGSEYAGGGPPAPARKSNWSPGASNAYRVNYPNVTDLPLQRYPHDFLLPRVWELRNNLTAYDAIYVALAEALDVPLLATSVLPFHPAIKRGSNRCEQTSRAIVVLAAPAPICGQQIGQMRA